MGYSTLTPLPRTVSSSSLLRFPCCSSYSIGTTTSVQIDDESVTRLIAQQYIARRILEINERGTWIDPSREPLSSAKMIKQDEGTYDVSTVYVYAANEDFTTTEIFQIARLCNCAWFAMVVFSDYFSAILGLVRQGSSWSLAPFGEFREDDHELFERGRGNACSVEVCGLN